MYVFDVFMSRSVFYILDPQFESCGIILVLLFACSRIDFVESGCTSVVVIVRPFYVKCVAILLSFERTFEIINLIFMITFSLIDTVSDLGDNRILF